MNPTVTPLTSNPGPGPHPTIVKTMIGRQTAGTPAGFWRRFAAIFIDGIIIGIALWPIDLVILLIYKSMTGVGYTDLAKSHLPTTITSYAIQLVAVYFYYGYFYSTRGASPGKSIMGLRVLNAETGTYLNYNQAFMREVIGKYLIDMLTLGIGYLIAAFRQDKRALHDLVFKTQVIKQEK